MIDLAMSRTKRMRLVRQNRFYQESVKRMWMPDGSCLVVCGGRSLIEVRGKRGGFGLYHKRFGGTEKGLNLALGAAVKNTLDKCGTHSLAKYERRG